MVAAFARMFQSIIILPFQIAEWNSQMGFVFAAPKYRRIFVDSGFKSNKTYIVTSILVSSLYLI